MSSQISCTACGSKLRVKEEHVGRKLRCPKCREIIVVPEQQPVVATVTSIDEQRLSSLPSDIAQVEATVPTVGVASQYGDPSPNGPAPRHSVNAVQHVVSGTSFHTTVGYIFLGISILVSCAFTFGFALIGWLLALLTMKSQTAKAQAALEASAIALSDHQFPEIYRSAMRMANQLGMRVMPDIFIMESNDQNAFAIKTGARKNVILIDDIVFGARATGDHRTLDFIIGHELAHHALGHCGIIRGLVRQIYRPLSRLDEFSCDAVANELLQDPEVSLKAITLLSIGPQLYGQVNQSALRDQVKRVMKDKKTKKSEATLTHPHILRRYGALTGHRI